MAKPVRVVFRSAGGAVSRRAPEEEKQRSYQAEIEIYNKWKEDPGIRYICYYVSHGAGLDGYSHHAVFELDDVARVNEMDTDIWTCKELLAEKFSFEVVFGDTRADEFWAS